MTETLREDLTALVGSRICHDLISPLGAIGNGLELLQLSGLPQGPEWALIAESVENASARIRFFRIAYGAADSASCWRAFSDFPGFAPDRKTSSKPSARGAIPLPSCRRGAANRCASNCRRCVVPA